MYFNEIIKSKNITKYRLSKESNVPYTTICDLCSGKTEISKASVETIYRLSKVLDVSMEMLVEPYIEHRVDFELFKSNTCHRVKNNGDVDFIIEVLEKQEIDELFKRQWYRECFYTLAMIDYLSNENDIPLCTQYNEIRKMKLKNILYPASVLTMAKVNKDEDIKKQALMDAIPEFINYNIVESQVRNVV